MNVRHQVALVALGAVPAVVTSLFVGGLMADMATDVKQGLVAAVEAERMAAVQDARLASRLIGYERPPLCEEDEQVLVTGECHPIDDADYLGGVGWVAEDVTRR
jgi:hypothetical protein